MLCLIFHLGADRYALDTAQIVEVLPWLEAKAVPRSHDGIAGIINYHGAPVPLVDLGQLAQGKAARFHMSTRIVLVDYVANDGTTHLLGLLAERVTGVEKFSPDQFVDPGVSAAGAPYLGPVVTDGRGTIQRVQVNDLLPDRLQDELFRAPQAAVP